MSLVPKTLGTEVPDVPACRGGEHHGYPEHLVLRTKSAVSCAQCNGSHSHQWCAVTKVDDRGVRQVDVRCEVCGAMSCSPWQVWTTGVACSERLFHAGNHHYIHGKAWAIEPTLAPGYNPDSGEASDGV